LQGQQWNIDRVKAWEAWDLLPPGGNTMVAVIDSGIDYDHPEFAGRISPNGCDQFHGDCLGSGGGTRARDDNGHGTHVAGIIGANTNNRTGIASVSGGRVTIIPVKALSVAGAGYTSDVLDSITYAVNKGAKVINMSLGGPCGETPRALDDAWRDAIVYAEQRDALIVKSAGNDGGCWEGRFPDTDSRVLSVAATDAADGSPIFTSRGAWVKVAAPGHRILSTYPGARGSYATLSGTSMAAPHVAAQAALLFQVPGATKAHLRLGAGVRAVRRPDQRLSLGASGREGCGSGQGPGRTCRCASGPGDHHARILRRAVRRPGAAAGLRCSCRRACRSTARGGLRQRCERGMERSLLALRPQPHRRRLQR
jgi:subtilisin family serine protease